MTFSSSDTVPKRRTKRGLRRFAIVMTVLAVATAWVAASTPSSATTPSAVRAAGVSADEITVGGLVTTTNFPQMGKAAQARFDEANKNKEIPGGRTIKYVSTAADEGTPDGALAAVRGLVEQDGVFAVVPAASVFSGPGTDDLPQLQAGAGRRLGDPAGHVHEGSEDGLLLRDHRLPRRNRPTSRTTATRPRP